MMEPVQIGAIFFGMIRLGLLVHQDYTKKMLVDDRANYFMFGCYAMLISAHLFPLWYIAISIAATIAIAYAAGSVFALSDQKAIAWIVGIVLFTIGPFGLVLFTGFLSFVFIASLLLYRLVARSSPPKKVPGFGYIAAAYVLTYIPSVVQAFATLVS